MMDQNANDIEEVAIKAPEKHHKVATIERERRARESVLSERESELKRKADR
jgi:hypothetical protein